MLYNRIYNIFKKSPPFLLKTLYLIPIKYRYGGNNFIDMYNFLKESERWDEDKLRRYQEKELQKFLEQAVKHASFYSKINISSENPFKNSSKKPVSFEFEKQT